MHGYLHNKKYHFVGVGGCGMSALAVFTAAQGAIVTGSDARQSPFTDRLSGIPVCIGHDAANVPPVCDAVIVSSAIKPDNCEYQQAQKRGIPIISRGRFLASVIEPKKVIAIVGSHGKTSTAALVSWIAVNGGCNCSALVGGIMNNFDSNVVVGSSDLVITEADESDGSMELITPDILVMLNIDDDHMQNYGTKKNMLNAYSRLIAKVRDKVVVNAKDQELRQIAGDSDKVVLFDHPSTISVDTESMRYTNDTMKLDISIESQPCSFETGLRGHLFMSNMLAAITCARLLNIDMDTLAKALRTYRGVKRRMEDWGVVHGIRIIEDYAHHPTEIAAMLRSVKQWHSGRVVCIFQPHRFTRSQQIVSSLADAFVDADELMLADIYTADETPIAGITGEYVFETVAKQRTHNISYIPDFHKIVDSVLAIVSSGDLVVFMGAGTIGSCAPQFKKKLEQTFVTQV